MKVGEREARKREAAQRLIDLIEYLLLDVEDEILQDHMHAEIGLAKSVLFPKSGAPAKNYFWLKEVADSYRLANAGTKDVDAIREFVNSEPHLRGAAHKSERKKRIKTLSNRLSEIRKSRK